MAIRRDPTMTGLLVRAYTTEIRRLLSAISRQVWVKIVEEDALGFEAPVAHLILHAERGVWRFHTNDQKLKAFDTWLEGVIEAEIAKAGGRKYVEAAHMKGVSRAFTDARKTEWKASSEWFQGTKDQFLRSIAGRPDMIAKIRLLASRSFEELKGITKVASTQISRVLVNGLLHGHDTKRIATDMVRQVKNLTAQRANLIAHNEIIHAHAEGQLDAFDILGIKEVGVYAEWVTAGDDRVCPLCQPLDGVIFTVEEARGLIPRHLRCRCSWVPASFYSPKDRKRTMRRKVTDSILAEEKKKGKGTKAKRLQRVRKQSSWVGREVL
jgi:SPP1 gp7 family putative phage head morphogenesis protein